MRKQLYSNYNLDAILSIRLKEYSPEKTARRIMPRRGLPRDECAHGNPWPGGIGNTCGPPPTFVVK